MEIEVKLKYKNKKEIINWLKQNGFKLSGKKEIRDSYYGLSNELSNKNSFYRLRNITGVLTELTLKDSFMDKGGIWLRREINIKIDDFEKMATVLISLGCNLIKEHSSKREIWKKDKVEFMFVDFYRPAKLSLIEIEGPNKETVQELVELLDNKVEIVGEEFFSVFDKKVKSASVV